VALSTPGKQLVKLLTVEEIASLSTSWLYGHDLELLFEPEFLNAATPEYSIVRLRELKENIEKNELAAEMMYPNKIITAGFSERITRTFGKPTVQLKLEKDENVH